MTTMFSAHKFAAQWLARHGWTEMGMGEGWFLGDTLANIHPHPTIGNGAVEVRFVKIPTPETVREAVAPMSSAEARRRDRLAALSANLAVAAAERRNKRR